jgi:organic radical activating enzyme
MSKNCHWALAAINYKNNDRITACPRGQRFLFNKSQSVLPSKIFNSQGFKDLRLSLEKGEFPDHCKSCKDWEDKNLESYRTNQNSVFWHDELADNVDKDSGETSFANLEYLEFRFSNTCNFSCLHCMPEYSSAWADIVRKTDIVEDDKDNGIIPLINDVKNQNWTIEEAEAVAEDLIANFPNLKRMDFAGGEPLYQKQFWAFLRKIVNHPNVANMHVTVISNFNTEVDFVELARLFNYFDTSTVRISVDGSEKIYKYFRTGNWETLKTNIETFKSVNQKTILETTCTISAYQMLTLKDSFYDMYFMQADKIHYTFVQYPTYLDPSILKSRFWSKIESDVAHIEKFLTRTNKHSAKTKTGKYLVEDIRALYAKSETKEEDYQKFLYYIDRMDKIKAQNFDDHFTLTKEDLRNAKPE